MGRFDGLGLVVILMKKKAPQTLRRAGLNGLLFVSAFGNQPVASESVKDALPVFLRSFGAA